MDSRPPSGPPRALTGRTALPELLHELGHAVHMLAAARQPHHSFRPWGAPADLSEVPATLFEEFAYDSRCLRVICCEPATGGSGGTSK